MNMGMNFRLDQRKFFVFKMHWPNLGGQSLKRMLEIGAQTRFFATTSLAHFEGLMKINKLNI